jgi:predicted CXXCH cytochrome family protein
MSRKKKPRRDSAKPRGETAPAVPPAPRPSAPARSGRRTGLLLAGLAVLVVAGLTAVVVGTRNPSSEAAEPAATVVPATYVGAQACASCHSKEHAAWKGSHHDLAMQVADDKTVLGNFSNAKFTAAGVTSTFFKRDGRFYVNTDGPDGKLADFEIKHTFGVTPLQQYLIELPGGRVQALGIAWDSRPQAQGGQRWFHLYPGRKLKAGDPLHWTGIDQNWNFQCADCHSTNLKKNYDAAKQQFTTAWSEINVACESCHGPASNHLAWAKKEGDWQRFAGRGKGLQEVLDERRGVTWAINPATGNAVRSTPRAGVREIETCARCHSRRGQFSDDFVHGKPLADTHRAALLDAALYWPDGQQRDEVYNYGSFLQSRMFAKGVTCSDCHEPHSLKLRAQGNAVCAQCHLSAKYDGPQHSFHPAGSKGGECTSCHMPTTTYMIVDPRHDHSMRIPRPDLSVKLGTPNACNQCHQDKKPEWAAAQIEKWYGHAPAGYQRFGAAFHAADHNGTGADASLRDVIADPEQPAIARASALARLRVERDPATLDAFRRSLNDSDPLVRRAAVSGLAQADPAVRVQLLVPRLVDPVRSVRMEAARALAGAPERSLAEADRPAFTRAIGEYVAAEQFNADRPESVANLGTLAMERGDVALAETQLKRAIALDPRYTPAVANLADLYRGTDREADADKVIRDALGVSPNDATLHYVLGLSLARQKRLNDAVTELAKAVQLAPDNARYAYVYAVALHSGGKVPAAIAVLEKAHQRFPADRDVLQGLIAFERDRGNRAAAQRWAQQLVALAPGDPQARQLAESLQK